MYLPQMSRSQTPSIELLKRLIFCNKYLYTTPINNFLLLVTKVHTSEKLSVIQNLINI